MSADAVVIDSPAEGDLGQWLALLSSDARRSIVAHLARDSHRGETSIGELAFAVGESRFSVSRHLQVMREAGLVYTAKQGNRTIVALEAEPMRRIDDWIWGIVSGLDEASK